jgi:GAF domain-containing protein
LGSRSQIVAEDLRTVLAAPLLVQDELIGCLNVYSRGAPRSFTQGEQELALIFAHEAATAIHNAQLYQDANRRNVYLAALLDASKAISSLSASSRQETLDRITEQAVEQVTGATGAKATWATIMLYHPALNQLSFESIYPQNLGYVEPSKHWVLDRDQAPDGKIGIVGRAVLQKRVLRVADVRPDTDYRALDPATRSELAVPLIRENQILGVLALESDRVGAFGEEDERVLTGLAELAAIAISNADRAEQLSRMNALAVMGAWEAEIAHDINREVGVIRRAVYMLQRDPELKPAARQRLQEIDRAANDLALPDDPGNQHLLERDVGWHDAALLDQVIRQEADKLQQDNPGIRFQLDLNCSLVRVGMRAQWLRRLTRHLIHNAIDAITPECEEQRITIRTLRHASRAEVQVEDTGKGVDPAVQPLLFERPIEHGEGQSGRGLLLVRFMAEQHGGYARQIERGPGEGSAFAIGIPLIEPPGDGS